MTYAEKRKSLSYYKFINNFLSILSVNANSILDVGSNGIDNISHLLCKEKSSLDIKNPLVAYGVKSIKEDFFIYKEQKKFDIVTCFQVLEHIDDVKKFAQKLLKLGKIIVVTVPYKWKKGICKSHIHDPVDIDKLLSWFNCEPIYINIISNRLFCVFIEDLSKKLFKINGGNFRDFFNIYDIDAQKQNKINIEHKIKHIAIKEYFKQKLVNDPRLIKYKNYTEADMINKAIPYNENTLNILTDALTLYPFSIDKYGHPLFLKELVRFLLKENEYDKALNILRSDIPSVNIMDTQWAKILFERENYHFPNIL
ncbi:hypothetical protein [Desulfovibrio sp. ZJ369]|uniref:hypothetical protein n=1 Tax=Desulfovibrio sp. ZJ369 TaxID=2709793 RepID=UPI0013EB1259|nr:hypothetical protein [Desulfovibrio sp. ZJ369]